MKGNRNDLLTRNGKEVMRTGARREKIVVSFDDMPLLHTKIRTHTHTQT